MSAASKPDERGPWASELVDLVRATSGGLLFGIPLLYTMEVWWTGSHTDPVQMLVVLGITFVPLFMLNRTAGFRSTRDVRLRDAVMDTVEGVALGLVLVTLVLVLLQELDGETPIAVILGKVVYEALPFCIGIGVANHFLNRGRDEPDDAARASQGGEVRATFADLGATVIGAVFVAFNVAPTDEVPMLASTMSPAWLVGIMGVSLIVSYAIVFIAGFAGEEARQSQTGIFQRPVTETVVCYLVALVASALMLWFFQRADGPWHVTLSHVVVLGLPAAVGGAAGRLAI